METLEGSGFDWITITSPEAAAVFVEAWRQAGEPPVRIAAVGKGSGQVLEALVPSGALNPGFTPSKVPNSPDGHALQGVIQPYRVNPSSQTRGRGCHRVS